MSYFFTRLAAFVAATSIAFVIGPSLMASRFAVSGWAFKFLVLGIVFAGVFTFLYCLSELVRATMPKWLSPRSPMAGDSLIATLFLLTCSAWLFWPRPETLSFGDNVGEIIDRGALTPHGVRVQLRAMMDCVGVALAFWVACRLVPIKSGHGRDKANA